MLFQSTGTAAGKVGLATLKYEVKTLIINANILSRTPEINPWDNMGILGLSSKVGSFCEIFSDKCRFRIRKVGIK